MFLDTWTPSWRACYAAFFTHVRSRSNSEATIANYTSILRKFFEDVGKAPQFISKAEIEIWIGSPCGSRDRGRAPAARTRNSRLVAISSFYSFANTFEYTDSQGALVPLTDRHPCHGIRQARVSVVQRGMSVDEFRQMLAVVPDDVRGKRDRAIFLSLFWSASRLQEVLSLSFGDLSQTTFFDPKTKQSRAGWNFTRRIKGGEIRTSEMPLPAVSAIQEYIQASGRHMEIDTPIFVAHAIHEFPPVDPWRSLSQIALWRRMRQYLIAAGLDPTRYSPHSIRRAAALSRYEAGSGVLEIMSALNHKNLAVSLKYLTGLAVQADTGAQLLIEKYGSF